MVMRQDASTGQMVDDGIAAAPEAKSGSERQMLHVKVYSPFRTYYDDQAYSLSAEDQTGPFDVLPRHHKFISLLTPCDISLDTAAGPQSIKIAGGILHVHDNQARILLDV
jgi:F0F1-type ATP synthase epsilon subunit